MTLKNEFASVEKRIDFSLTYYTSIQNNFLYHGELFNLMITDLFLTNYQFPHIHTLSV